MRRLKILLFGNLPLSTKVCKLLLEAPKVDLIAVVLGKSNPVNVDPFEEIPLLNVFAEEEKLATITLSDLATKFEDNYFDYGISCRFDKILKKEHINKFRSGVINFHGGLLPEFGGLYSSCHTILEESKKGGGTIHYIDEGIDTGDIIMRAEFDVADMDTSETIFKKTQIALYDGFVELLPKIISNRVSATSQQELLEKGHIRKYYQKDSIIGQKRIKFSDNEKTICKKVRAFDFPFFEPAYFVINDTKYYVRTNFRP